LCSAKIATAEKGALLFDEYVDGVARALAAEFGVTEVSGKRRGKAAE
jgi:hypothetical protein